MVHDGPTCYVILNLFPYNGGHLMVVPRRHVATLGGLTTTSCSTWRAPRGWPRRR